MRENKREGRSWTGFQMGGREVQNVGADPSRVSVHRQTCVGYSELSFSPLSVSLSLSTATENKTKVNPTR